MSNKYISQINNTNFIYPNYDLAEYDVDVIQNINDNSVSGTISNFVVSGTARTTGITFTHDWTWAKNSADVFISSSGQIHLLSVHMIAAGQTYYKPFRCVDIVTSGTTGSSTYSGSNTVTVTPSMMGLTTFSSGTYYFEIRMIGLKSIYPICQTLSITVS
jgi:hypothetical protein